MANNASCTHCGKPVILVPSASARAAKYGQTPDYYKRLFPAHADCQLAARAQGTLELMRRLNHG